ncbi:hypothetical protein QWA68_016472 [Fusarium oxysporum]|nr:hypothetical protein QWA68_016472 [Fusarium oxysporum]
MGGQPSIRWADDEEALFHMGEEVNIEKFTRTLRGQVTEAHKMLDRLFGGSWQKVSGMIDMGRITDSMVMLVTDRDKMKAIRDNGRKVARFLPDPIGRMIVAYISWLIPAERVLRRECQLTEPRDDQLEYMWRDGGSRVWDTERLSRKLARVMQAGTGVRIGVGRYRAITVEIGRRIRGLVMRQLDSQMEDEDEDDNIEVDLITEGSSAGEKDKEKRSKKNAPKRKQDSQVTGQQSRKRRKTAQEVAQKMEDDITEGLQALLGPKATWRSEKQAESMRAIMSLKTDQTAINVLPTGARKSILFMLPAVMQLTGISIVVVPYVALMDDLVTQATAIGVDYIQYRTSISAGREEVPRAARLVVVSANIVSSDQFFGYADGLLCAGLLKRIFINKYHTVIMDISYRAKLGELIGLRRFGCPIVLLTATLPVVLEDWFRGEMLAKSAIVVRDRTVKLNCQYQVQQVKLGKGALEERTVEVIRQLDREMTGRQKGVIYCRSKKQCEAIAEEIGCGFYYSGMSEKDRVEAQSAWIDGQASRWIAATTGLGTGIDIEGIVAVVHMEKPYGLVDFVQQTGRGGRRAGEVVKSIVVHNGRPERQDLHRSFVDSIN